MPTNTNVILMVLSCIFIKCYQVKKNARMDSNITTFVSLRFYLNGTSFFMSVNIFQTYTYEGVEAKRFFKKE
jgi:hypothetical protein